MDEKILKRLREKIVKGLKLPDEGPPLSDLFLLIQDLNFLYFRLLRELGDLSTHGYISPEILAVLLKVEPEDGNKIISLGEELLGCSDGELLQGSGLLQLICLHSLPESADLIFPVDHRIIPAHQLIEKDRIIALLLEQIRLLKENQ